MTKTQGTLLLILAFLIASCSEKTEILTVPALADYFPMQTGKFIIYKMDSTVPTKFGADTTVRSYLIKYSFDGIVKDGQNRDAYRVVRSIKPLGSLGDFITDQTYTATQLPTSVEWMENNLRFVKLVSTIKEGFSWQGNNYIETNSFGSPFKHLANWQYTYHQVGQPFTINGKTFENTLTVLQMDAVDPAGPFDPNYVKTYRYSIEVYAKQIGLVYKNFAFLDWQPPTPPPDPEAGYWTDFSHRVKLEYVSSNF